MNPRRRRHNRQARKRRRLPLNLLALRLENDARKLQLTSKAWERYFTEFFHTCSMPTLHARAGSGRTVVQLLKSRLP